MGSSLGEAPVGERFAELIQDRADLRPGDVLLGHPNKWATASDRAGSGSVGKLGGLAGLVLKGASFFGIGGMDMVGDIERWKRSRWLPVVLVLERNEDGSAMGVALTARTGTLLGDVNIVDGFATRPVHWGGPDKASLFLVHPHPEVKGSRPLANSGLCEGGELADAQACVESGTGSSLSFRFFVGKVRWGPGELESELASETWLPVRCSEGYVLDESEGLGGQPLWAELATTVGGEVERIGLEWDLLG